MNPNTPQGPKSKLPFSTGSAKGKILLVLGIGVVLVIVLVAGASILGGSNNGASTSLLEVLQEQTELTRVADLARNNAKQNSTQALATNIQLSVSSAEQQILPLAKKRGVKIDSKYLNAKQNTATDKKLKDASENSQFDTVFVQTMSNQLKAYKDSLSTSYKQISSKKEQLIVKTAYDGAALLLTSTQSN